MSIDIVAAGSGRVSGFERDLLLLMKPLRAFAMALTKSAAMADDLTQDTLLRALTKSHQFMQGSNLKAWTFTIMRNEHLSKLRKSGREVGGDEAFWQVVGNANPAPDSWAIERMDLMDVWQVMPTDRLALLIAVDVDGIPYEQLAEQYGVALGTVKSRISRSRDVIRSLLGEAYGATEQVPKTLAAKLEQRQKTVVKPREVPKRPLRVIKAAFSAPVVLLVPSEESMLAMMRKLLERMLEQKLGDLDEAGQMALLGRVMAHTAAL